MVAVWDVQGDPFQNLYGEIREDTGHWRRQRDRGVHPRVSVVIPALNEAKNLPHVLSKLPKDIYEVILVDGDSVDGTIDVARELCPEIRIVRQSGRGKGDALAAGFAAVRGDIIVMLDADGSADPAEIKKFVEVLLEGADFAKGSRFLTGGGSTDITRFRTAGNFGLTLIANLLFGVRFSDLCYGYNAFWTQCLPYIIPDTDGFEIETLINVRAVKAGVRVQEVPSHEGQRIHGVSNLNAFRDGWRVLRTLARERLSAHIGETAESTGQNRPSHAVWRGPERRRGVDRRSIHVLREGSYGRRATDFRPAPEVLPNEAHDGYASA